MSFLHELWVFFPFYSRLRLELLDFKLYFISLQVIWLVLLSTKLGCYVHAGCRNISWAKFRELANILTCDVPPQVKLYRYEDPAMGPRTMPTMERPLKGKVIYYYSNIIIIINNIIIHTRWRSRPTTCSASTLRPTPPGWRRAATSATPWYTWSRAE